MREKGREEGISSISVTTPSRQEAGPALQHSASCHSVTYKTHIQSQICCAAQGQCRAHTPECCSWSLGRASSPILVTKLEPILLPASRVDKKEEEGGDLFLVHATTQQTRGRPGISTLTSLGPTYPQSPHSGSALLCCPGEEQGQLSQVLQQVRDRASSSALMTSQPAFMAALGGKGPG